tara:strand:- start:414 stop:566 length:153 start_codon:yes stop_codon:yes gene_type:complete
MKKLYRSPLFTGSMFVGMGLGFMCDQIPGGVLIGMGVGFLLSYFLNNHEK